MTIDMPEFPDAPMMLAPEYVTKTSGQRESFSSGAVRDVQEDKPRYDLIPPEPLRRLAMVYMRGGKNYGDHNWEQGMPLSRILASAERHLQQARNGEHDEDHWAQCAWNLFAIMHFEHTGWNDLNDWTPSEPPEEEI